MAEIVRNNVAEDVYYKRKIEELANEWLTFFRDQKKLREEQVNEAKNSKAIITKHDRKRKKVVPTKAVRGPVVINEVTERLKEYVVNEMKGTEVQLVIQKIMYKSDTEKGLNRLNMPVKQLESDEFLREDERGILGKKNSKENEIEVMVLGPTLEVYEEPMKLKMWHMASTVNYVLTTNWYRFWKENETHLMENSKIQVWSFRRDEKLCFAVICVG